MAALSRGGRKDNEWIAAAEPASLLQCWDRYLIKIKRYVSARVAGAPILNANSCSDGVGRTQTYVPDENDFTQRRKSKTISEVLRPSTCRALSLTKINCIRVRTSDSNWSSTGDVFALKTCSVLLPILYPQNNLRPVLCRLQKFSNRGGGKTAVLKSTPAPPIRA